MEGLTLYFRPHFTPFGPSHFISHQNCLVISLPTCPCPIPPFSTGNSNRVNGPNGPCPTGFERVNGSCVGRHSRGRRGMGGLVFQGWAARDLVVPDWPKTSSTLADVDECATGGRCQHGECANTRGGYTCVCPDGFLLDSSRSSCICEPPGKGEGL